MGLDWIVIGVGIIGIIVLEIKDIKSRKRVD